MMNLALDDRTKIRAKICSKSLELGNYIENKSIKKFFLYNTLVLKLICKTSLNDITKQCFFVVEYMNFNR